MICFLVAGALTFAAIKFWHRQHQGCWAGYRGMHGGAGFGYDGNLDSGGGFYRRFRTGRRTPFIMNFLSNRLDATPGQERALASAIEQFQEDLAPLQAEVAKTRSDLAAAMRRSSFDEVAMGELFARHDEAIEKARRAVVGLGARVHEALDERQRDQLASLLERGHGFSGFGRGW